MDSFLKWLLSTFLTGVGSFLTQWIKAEDYDEAQRQLGKLEYENIAKNASLEQAKAAATTGQLIRSLDDDELLKRVRATTEDIRLRIGLPVDSSSDNS